MEAVGKKSVVFLSKSIAILVALLFVYAAVSKILEFENFQAQLGQSPLISAYTGFISYTVLILELTISLLLIIPQTRLVSLYAAAALMVMFTTYIVAILNFSANIPCSCGGILESMGWKAHLIFNIVITILCFIAVLILSPNWTDALLNLAMIIIVGSALMTGLYILSEHLMHKENPFVRRFISGSAFKKQEARLPYNTMYFAGVDRDAIYIVDVMAPLYITTYDTLLNVKQQSKIELDDGKLPFRSIKVQVLPPYFYVIDGTVPIIYRGKIGEWKAKAILKDAGYYFSKATIVDSTTFVFRTQLDKSGENALGIAKLAPQFQANIRTDLLQKQIDGFFDTDGMMVYDDESELFAYLYYYRNQFIVTDKYLNIRYRGNTIDTTSRANIKVAYIKGKRQHKLASVAVTTNKVCAIRDNLLFVRSGLRGKYEPKEMWDIASIVDVYDIKNMVYMSSVYIYDFDTAKVNEIAVFGNNLYVINGFGLQRYKLAQDLKKDQPYKNLPAGDRDHDRKPVK